MTTTKPELKLYKLGEFLDGWADLVENMGGKVSEVRKKLSVELKRRKMPDVEVYEVDGRPTSLSNETRFYTSVSTDPGATATVYVGKHGEDLYIAWRTYFRLIFNMELLKTILTIGAVIGGGYFIFNTLQGLWNGLSIGLFTSGAAKRFWITVFQAIGFSAIGVVLFFSLREISNRIRSVLKKPFEKLLKSGVWPAISIMITVFREYLIRGYLIPKIPTEWKEIVFSILFWFYVLFIGGYILIRLFKELLDFLISTYKEKNKSIFYTIVSIIFFGYIVFFKWTIVGVDLSNMFSYIWRELQYGLYSFSYGLRLFAGFFVGVIILLILGGLFFKRSLLFYLLVQPNQFDVEDISAMSLAVHKSILRVLDDSGIDISQLRIKEKFTGGRKGEDI
jgi:hypothetical protein